jgi:hypothetical protein
LISDELRNANRRDWRELGFFYYRDDSTRTWRIVGSVSALGKFSALLREYAANPSNERLSEYEIYGPYLYLEIGTWDKAEITDHWIAAPLANLTALAALVEERLADAVAGETLGLRDSFAPDSTWELNLEVHAEPFDPAALDENAR